MAASRRPSLKRVLRCHSRTFNTISHNQPQERGRLLGYNHRRHPPGVTAALPFDPGRLQWNLSTPLLGYSVKLGRQLLASTTQLQRSIPEKWRPMLPQEFIPN